MDKVFRVVSERKYLGEKELVSTTFIEKDFDAVKKHLKKLKYKPITIKELK